MSCYISEKLCHFIGRSLKSQDDQFNLMVKIIKDGVLLFNPQKPEEKFTISSSLLPKISGLGEIFQNVHCVCFCDIPDDALGIHTSKYSRFGIGFSRKFVVAKGARPVLYVPVDGMIQQVLDKKLFSSNPEEYFKEWLNESWSLSTILTACIQKQSVRENLLFLDQREIVVLRMAFQSHIEKILRKEALTEELYHTLSGNLLSMLYTKFYDSSLCADDPNNFYFEREWRSISNVIFSQEDICSVYLPSDEYRTRFQDVFPHYQGDIIILESQ